MLYANIGLLECGFRRVVGGWADIAQILLSSKKEAKTPTGLIEVVSCESWTMSCLMNSLHTQKLLEPHLQCIFGVEFCLSSLNKWKVNSEKP